jgi:hypothetical protein
MKGAFASVLTLVMMSIPIPLSAKGATVKITIKGADLATPIEITDPTVRDFSVWAGPGVYVNGIEQTEGFIIQWSKGIVAERPNGLQRYEVSFYTGCDIGEWGCRSSKPSLSYVVFYDYDPSMEQGYVYLPGKADELSKFSGMWHGHGFEGNWLRATSEWENFVRPLIAKATVYPQKKAH